MSSKSFSQIITVNLQYHDIKITKQCSDVNCVKIVGIWGLSGSYYATFWVNTGTYSGTLHMQYKWKKNLHQKKTTNTNVYVSWSVTVALKCRTLTTSQPKKCIFGMLRLSLKSKDIITTTDRFKTRTVRKVYLSPVMGGR